MYSLFHRLFINVMQLNQGRRKALSKQIIGGSSHYSQTMACPPPPPSGVARIFPVGGHWGGAWVFVGGALSHFELISAPPPPAKKKSSPKMGPHFRAEQADKQAKKKR